MFSESFPTEQQHITLRQHNTAAALYALYDLCIQLLQWVLEITDDSDSSESKVLTIRQFVEIQSPMYTSQPGKLATDDDDRWLNNIIETVH